MIVLKLIEIAKFKLQTDKKTTQVLFVHQLNLVALYESIHQEAECLDRSQVIKMRPLLV